MGTTMRLMALQIDDLYVISMTAQMVSTGSMLCSVHRRSPSQPVVRAQSRATPCISAATTAAETRSDRLQQGRLDDREMVVAHDGGIDSDRNNRRTGRSVVLPSRLAARPTPSGAPLDRSC
jgi:hypothetical protein